MNISLDCKFNINETILSESREMFFSNGLLILENVFNVNENEKVNENLENLFFDLRSKLESKNLLSSPDALFSEISYRGKKRYEVSFSSKSPLVDKINSLETITNARNQASKLATAILGEKEIEISKGMVVSEPTAPEQKLHQDGQNLFVGFQLPLPPHAITVFLVTENIEIEAGPTIFYPKSHFGFDPNMEKVQQNLKAGSLCLFDYRLSHKGAENKSEKNRCLPFIVYGKPWFQDNLNLSIKDIGHL